MRLFLAAVAVALAAACAPLQTTAEPPRSHLSPPVEPGLVLIGAPGSAVDARPAVLGLVARPRPKLAHGPTRLEQPASTPAPAPAPPARPAPPPPAPPRGGDVPALIRAYFPGGEEAAALCVAWRESRYNPLARNRYSGAAGVFQWMPRSWATYSARAGWGGASVYSARANIAVAAWAVTHGGWGPWGGGC